LARLAERANVHVNPTATDAPASFLNNGLSRFAFPA
jgi:hypothetical protein